MVAHTFNAGTGEKEIARSLGLLGQQPGLFGEANGRPYFKEKGHWNLFNNNAMVLWLLKSCADMCMFTSQYIYEQHTHTYTERDEEYAVYTLEVIFWDHLKLDE